VDECRECGAVLVDVVLREVQGLGSLKQVLEWSLARRPRAEFIDVVVQDEFHHDVIVRVSEDVFAAFETS
jgi:hypothetical protein